MENLNVYYDKDCNLDIIKSKTVASYDWFW